LFIYLFVHDVDNVVVDDDNDNELYLDAIHILFISTQKIEIKKNE
jgi:hypothetical protein